MVAIGVFGQMKSWSAAQAVKESFWLNLNVKKEQTILPNIYLGCQGRANKLSQWFRSILYHQIGPISCILFFEAQPFFLVIATVKTRPVLKRGCQGLSKEGYTNWRKSLGHEEKVMFLGHDLKT